MWEVSVYVTKSESYVILKTLNFDRHSRTSMPAWNISFKSVLHLKTVSGVHVNTHSTAQNIRKVLSVLYG